MGPKHTGELWVYIGTPLPKPFGEYRRDVMYVKNIYILVMYRKNKRE